MAVLPSVVELFLDILHCNYCWFFNFNRPPTAITYIFISNISITRITAIIIANLLPRFPFATAVTMHILYDEKETFHWTLWACYYVSVLTSFYLYFCFYYLSQTLLRISEGSWFSQASAYSLLQAASEIASRGDGRDRDINLFVQKRYWSLDVRNYHYMSVRNCDAHIGNLFSRYISNVECFSISYESLLSMG